MNKNKYFEEVKSNFFKIKKTFTIPTELLKRQESPRILAKLQKLDYLAFNKDMYYEQLIYFFSRKNLEIKDISLDEKIYPELQILFYLVFFKPLKILKILKTNINTSINYIQYVNIIASNLLYNINYLLEKSKDNFKSFYYKNQYDEIIEKYCSNIPNNSDKYQNQNNSNQNTSNQNNSNQNTSNQNNPNQNNPNQNNSNQNNSNQNNSNQNFDIEQDSEIYNLTNQLFENYINRKKINIDLEYKNYIRNCLRASIGMYEEFINNTSIDISRSICKLFLENKVLKIRIKKYTNSIINGILNIKSKKISTIDNDFNEEDLLITFQENIIYNIEKKLLLIDNNLIKKEKNKVTIAVYLDNSDSMKGNRELTSRIILNSFYQQYKRFFNFKLYLFSDGIFKINNIKDIFNYTSYGGTNFIKLLKHIQYQSIIITDIDGIAQMCSNDIDNNLHKKRKLINIIYIEPSKLELEFLKQFNLNNLLIINDCEKFLKDNNVNYEYE